MGEKRVVVTTAAVSLVIAVVSMPAGATPCGVPDDCLGTCEGCALFEPSFEQAYHEMTAVNEAYAIAREHAARAISKHRNEPSIVEDLAIAIDYGDDAVAALQTAAQWTPKRIEEVVRLLWSVVAHIVNATLEPAARI